MSAVLILDLGGFMGMNKISYICWLFMAVKIAVCLCNYCTDKLLALSKYDKPSGEETEKT